MSEKAKEFYDLKVKKANGTEQSLEDLKTKVVLVVNVASKCGFTPQYKELQSLYEEYQKDGLEILGFPCNQFMSQEPGSAEDIQQFCEVNFKVSFPIFGKVDVNGKETAPIYTLLKEKAPGLLGTKSIKWNFTKFLIGRDGVSVERFSPNTSPKDLKPQIERLLKK